tara:strand:- start:2230 stop:2949 length:720 start_codon:yes stop_codon:yes gene_type:complete
MARISTYPIDTDIVGTDKWIGSDSQNFFSTKNFTADAVATFINGYNKVDSNSLRYTYKDFVSTRETGTLSFETTQGVNVNFSTVNTFMLSEYQKSRPLDSLANFYTSPLKGSMVMISQTDKISNWGVFNWSQSTEDPSELKFYDISLQYVSGPGYFEDDLDYFVTLLQYDTSLSNDKNAVHTQSVASSIWIVNHGLNKYCSVNVVNSSNIEVYADIEYTSLNTVTITFSSPQQGYAYFN